MRRALPETFDCNIVILTSNKAAALAVHHPQQQSGQEYIRCIYDSVDSLRARRNNVTIQWVPSSDENELLLKAKGEAKEMTKQGAAPEKQFPAIRSTTLNIARSKVLYPSQLPYRTRSGSAPSESTKRCLGDTPRNYMTSSTIKKPPCLCS